MRRIALSTVALTIAALAAGPEAVNAQGAGTYLIASFEHDLNAALAIANTGDTRPQARGDGWNYYTDHPDGLTYSTDSCSATANFNVGGGSCGMVTPSGSGGCPNVHPPGVGTYIAVQYMYQQTFTGTVAVDVVAIDGDCGGGDGQRFTVQHITNNIIDNGIAGYFREQLQCPANFPDGTSRTEVTTGRSTNDGVRFVVDRRAASNWDSTDVQMLIYASCTDACTSQFCQNEYERSCVQGLPPAYVTDQCDPGTPAPTVTPVPPTTTTTTTTTTTAAPTPACDCDAEKLEAIYSSDAIPDATADAISNISLDTDSWEVVFEVRNVRAIKNGHVIAAAVNTQETAANAFTPLVDNFQPGDLWAPQACGLGGIDTPATNLKVRTEWDNAACRTKYEMRYSLIDASVRDDTYCDLTDG